MQGAQEKDVSNCIFCKIVANEIPSYRVWENADFIAFLNINPIAQGHLLVIPKAHIDSIFDLPGDMYRGLFEAGRMLAGPVKQVTSCKRVGLSVVGLDVSHAHLHVLPMNHPGDADHVNAKPASKDDLVAMQAKIKSAIVL